MNPDEVSADDSSSPYKVTLIPVAALCSHGECPTLYRTNRDTLVVQGYRFEPDEIGITVPDGERMVEIPLELLAEFTRTQT